jgi:hypothetical protein
LDSGSGSFYPSCELYLLVCEQVGWGEDGVLSEYLLKLKVLTSDIMRLLSGFLFLALLMICTGCSSHPVRHLASDVILIKPGVSTKQDVSMYLGEPDGTRTVSRGIDEFVYHEVKKSSLSRIPMTDALSRIPVLDSLTGDKGYEMIVIIFDGDIVRETELRTFNRADHAWVDDFTWQEIK